jgi:hypothetical protein
MRATAAAPADTSPPPPSGRQLALASAAALLAAVVILVVAVLPAEYGIDPLGIGARLGLVPDPPVAADAAPASPAAADVSAAPLAPATTGPIGYYSRPFAVDHVTFELGPYEYVEYKYRLEAGASVHFSWEASSPVMHDFHADPDGADGHDPVSFDSRELGRADGTHRAPFAGMHGWLWENPGSGTIHVSLTSAGFYTSATEYRSNGTRIAHEVDSRDTLVGALAPADRTGE